MYFIVSIDTEEDMPHWRPESITTVKNIQALPDLQKIFDSYGILPTYLVNYPILENAVSCDTINGLYQTGNCEIGCHLHAWNTPPIMTEEKNGMATVMNQFTDAVQSEKIRTMHNLFKNRLGFSPKSHRAGRYGITRTSIKMLSSLGYSIDSSVVPMTDFSGYGAPDFRGFSADPFWIQTNGSKILELPISVDLVSKLSRKFNSIYFDIPDWSHLKGVLHRLNLARLLWLRPTTYSVKEMKQIVHHIIKNSSGPPIFNMMFHSSECYPGASPYNSTPADVKNFYNRLEQLLKFIVKDIGAKPVTMNRFAELLKSNKQIFLSEKSGNFLQP